MEIQKYFSWQIPTLGVPFWRGGNLMRKSIKNILRGLCLVMILWIVVLDFTVMQALAATYYVGPNGNNSNPGTREQPWATPGYGSRQLQPGDTLIILGGRYVLSEYDADVITPLSGTASAWITIQGEEGNRPVLAGRNGLLTAINLSGVQYVHIQNLEITHDDTASGEAMWFREGVEILGTPSAHIILQDLYIHHIDEYGMNIQDVEDLQILNCRLEYCGYGSLGGPAGEHGGWRNVVIRGCSLSWAGHYYRGSDGSLVCTGEPTDPPYCRPYDRPDGFGIEPSQGPILIEDTIAEHNYGDGLDSKAANTTIRRCIVANNTCDGVKVWADNSRIENTIIYGRRDGNPETAPWSAIVIDQVEQAGARFEIVNVTVDDYVGNNYLMYVQYDNPLPVQVMVRNSIFSGRGPNCPIYVHSNSTLVADHNLFYLPQNERLLTKGETIYTCANIASLGEGNFCGDPLFVRTAWGTVGDYHIQASSPAVDAGVCTGAPTNDFEGDQRPQGAACDIGADEFTTSSSCTPPFTDVPCDHWAIDYIRAIKDAGITTGYPDGTFRPENQVTRAQMAVFIIRAIEGEPVSYNPNPYFADVPPTHWAFKYVQRVRERGIAQGYPGNNLYGPEDNVTREQMAKMLIMGLVSQGKTSEPPTDYCSTGAPFDDVSPSSWSCRYIKKLKELGITQGCNPPDNNRYCPQNPVTRAQMATFIYRGFLQ